LAKEAQAAETAANNLATLAEKTTQQVAKATTAAKVPVGKDWTVAAAKVKGLLAQATKAETDANSDLAVRPYYLAAAAA
jgi:hypothetical protein